MGGKALSFETKRLSSYNFVKIRDEVNKILLKDNIKTYPIRSYHTKETHGDLDILIKNDNILKNIISNNFNDFENYINKKFKPNEIYYNGGVFSFDYKNFQIDLNVVKEDDWEISKYYLDYNDLGNLIGRIAIKLGLKFGSYGLKFIYYPTSSDKYEIILSKDPEKIFNCLGFDFNYYINEGFDYLEDIFDFVINSKYFNPYFYHFENLNQKHKKRDSKRKNYLLFLEYIKKNVNVNNYDYKIFDFEDTLNFINYYFPDVNIYDFISKCDFQISKKEIIKEKYNGNLVQDKLKLDDKTKISYYMNNFRKYVEDNKNKSLEDWIYENDENIIWNVFDDFQKVLNYKN